MAETRSQTPLKFVMTNETKEILESRLVKLKETYEDYFAQIREELHAVRLLYRSRKGKKENPEDQALNDEELVETEAATESIVCEDSVSVIGCDELCEHQRWILQDSHVRKVEKSPQQSTKGDSQNVAHQVFEQMPLRVTSKKKQRKSLKAWKFKFKHRVASRDFKSGFEIKRDQKTSKEYSSLFMSHVELPLPKEYQDDSTKLIKSSNDDELSFSQKTDRVWEPGGLQVKRDHWDWPEKQSKSHQGLLQVERFSYSQLLVFDSEQIRNNKLLLYAGTNMVDILSQRLTGSVIHRLSLANHVWKPGGLLCVQYQWDWIKELHSRGSDLKIMQRFHGLHFQEIINMDMKLREVIVNDVLSVKICLRVWNREFEAELEIYLLAHHNSRNQKILSAYRRLVIKKFSWFKTLSEMCCVLLGMSFAAFGRGKTELLVAGQKMQSRLVFDEEKNGLRNDEDGVKQDKNRFSGDVRAKRFMALEELHLLQDVFEMVNKQQLKTSVVLQQVMRNRKIKFSKRWWFKYKAPNLDTKLFETSVQCIRERLFASADRGTKNNKSTMRLLMNTKQSCLSLRADRVWDPGGLKLVASTEANSPYTRLVLKAAASNHLNEGNNLRGTLANQREFFLSNLEVKVFLKGEDLLQESDELE